MGRWLAHACQSGRTKWARESATPQVTKARCTILKSSSDHSREQTKNPDLWIEALIWLRKTKFEAGSQRLQSYLAQAIKSYLCLVIWNKHKGMHASQPAAEALGFLKVWGGQQVWCWVHNWINKCDLPQPEHGCHIKVRTLLEDPSIRAELWTYVCSNKWAVNPTKLQEFTNQTMLPDEAAKYCQQICDKEMPSGLKKYMEVELFPHICMKVGKGIAISTAHWWLHAEGCKYTLHKKAIYYNGHDRADVVADWQEHFLLAMTEYHERLVEYKMGNPMVEVQKNTPLVLWRLVLVVHDESTCMENDGPKASWVIDGEQPILKKGVGRGSHQSDVICSMVGWIESAGVQIEYGKNYDGFWKKEDFVNQVYLKVLCVSLPLISQ